MIKFEDATGDVIELFEKVKTNLFPELNDALFKLVWRNKKKGKKDGLVFAEVMSPGEFTRYLTSEEANEENGFDFIVIIDKLIYNNIDEEDKVRLLRHELRHCVYNPSKEDRKSQYGLRDHTVQDFYEDVAIEAQAGGDPQWKERILEIGLSLYEEQAEKKKAEKKLKKKQK